MTEKVPARLNVVTFGVGDLPAVRNFYEALGWESHSAGDEFVRFEIGGAVLALYPLDALTEEADIRLSRYEMSCYRRTDPWWMRPNFFWSSLVCLASKVWMRGPKLVEGVFCEDRLTNLLGHNSDGVHLH